MSLNSVSKKLRILKREDSRKVSSCFLHTWLHVNQSSEELEEVITKALISAQLLVKLTHNHMLELLRGATMSFKDTSACVLLHGLPMFSSDSQGVSFTCLVSH